MVLIIFTNLAFIEVMSLGTLSFPWSPFAGQVHRARNFSREEYEAYLSERDAVLGWPRRSTLRRFHTASGARIAPSSEAYSRPCVSLYGDSFTYSVGVTHEQAWGNVLAAKIGCRVDNFGVGGYGIDQAVLRFQLNDTDRAPLVILGIVPNDLQRNFNQWRSLLGGRLELDTLKPSFREREGGLELVPLPTFSFAETSRLAQSPQLFLRNELFLPDSQYGNVTLRFPYSLRFLKLVRGRLRQLERPIRFDGALPVFGPRWRVDLDIHLERSRRIVLRFAELCAARNRKCFVLMIPDYWSLAEFRRTRQLAMAPIYRGFAPRIEVLDATAPLVARLSGRSHCDFMGATDCRGHYNAAGYAALADTVATFIGENSGFRTHIPQHRSPFEVRSPVQGGQRRRQDPKHD